MLLGGFPVLSCPARSMVFSMPGQHARHHTARDAEMKCQLVSTVNAGRRTRGICAYLVIWWRAASRFARWYFRCAQQIVGGDKRIIPAGVSPQRQSVNQRRLRAGDWVRVRSRSEIERQQQDADISDVVAFIPAPMSRYCGRTLRVLRVLEHYYDEVRADLCRAENAVLLEGATCDSSQLGGRHCDRGCLHFWKESWLERVADPGGDLDKDANECATGIGSGFEVITERAGAGSRARVQTLRNGELVRVKSEERITKTLDAYGVCEGVPFIPEHMTVYCGRIFTVSRAIRHFIDEKADYMIRLPRAYMLSSVFCDGRQAGGEPQCDRGCTLVWHAEWLERACLDSVKHNPVDG